MKRTVMLVYLWTAVLLGAAAAAAVGHEAEQLNPEDWFFVIRGGGGSAQAQQQVTILPAPTTRLPHRRPVSTAHTHAFLDQGPVTPTIPLSPYRVVSPVDQRTYTGVMVGQSPSLSVHTTTTIPTLLIPVEIIIAGHHFNPNAPDACLGGQSVTTVTANSPLFQPAPFTMNGILMGTTQYGDAFQRANFWSVVGGTQYHTLLALQVHATVVVDATATAALYNAVCQAPDLAGLRGGIEINAWDAYVRQTLIPALGITPDQFPIFLFRNVGLYDGSPTPCCIGGYHDAFTTTNMQTYATADFDTSGNFGAANADVAALSHEIAEWLVDPDVRSGGNPTPAWGHTGQVADCQTNLEVGDPLTGTQFPAVTLNGFTYHLPELAFFDWFFRTPPQGAKGYFSNDATFARDAGPLCH